MRNRMWGMVLLGCVISAPVWAQDEDKEAKEFKAKSTKSYVLISAGRSDTPAACDAGWRYQTNSACSKKGTIYRIGYGYNFNSLLAMEVSYGDFAHAREDGWDSAPPSIILGGTAPTMPMRYYRTWSATGWELAAVGTIHLGPYVSLHGKAGWLRANVEEEIWWYPLEGPNSGQLWHGNYKEANNTASASGGIQIDFNRDVGMRFQVNRYNKLGGYYKFKTTSVLASLVMKF